MTTLARTFWLPGTSVEGRAASPAVGAASLLSRLHEETNRQVPFSQARLLLREAASAIERLEADLARVKTELEGERAGRPGR